MLIKYPYFKNAFYLKRAFWVTVLLSTGLLFGLSPQPASAAAGKAEPTTWTVQVGGQAEVEQGEYGPAGAWQFMRFYPETITINAGDTIVWKLNSAEPHTVTFPKPGEKGPELVIPETEGSQQMMFNPLAVMPQGESTYDDTVLTGSGQIGGEAQFPTEYKLTFTKPGTYDYICAFHQMMVGKVIVQAAGTAYPQTQAQIDEQTAKQLEADKQAALKIEPGLMKETTRPGPNGTTIYQVKIGYGDGTMAWMRFGPANLNINVGDTVEWTQDDVETPHTVTLTSGEKEPEMVIPESQAGGPPKLLLNSQVTEPAGGATYSGIGYFNSGFIWGTKVPIPGPRTYSLTFDTPGTYEYICVLHDMMGMNGHITVQAQGAPAQLPTTGGEYSNQSWLISWLLAGGAGLIIVGLIVFVIVKGTGPQAD
jgi:plastocyanin